MSEEKLKLAEELIAYCKKYFIPIDHIFEILNDQKVVPMIRGKGMEYNAVYAITEVLNPREWITQKLNLSPQPGTLDQDISLTHRRSGIIVTVESKSAVRASFHRGSSRTTIKEPHFKVKCHRSRSNMQLANTSNDRYHISSFDILITTPLNCLYIGNTIGEDFEFLPETDLEILFEFYGVNNVSDLEDAASKDWRFALSKDIAEDEYIPRTPFVRLKDDPNWKPLSKLSEKLLQIVEGKRRN
jgi:hypothetical protein